MVSCYEQLRECIVPQELGLSEVAWQHQISAGFDECVQVSHWVSLWEALACGPLIWAMDRSGSFGSRRCSMYGRIYSWISRLPSKRYRNTIDMEIFLGPWKLFSVILICQVYLLHATWATSGGISSPSTVWSKNCTDLFTDYMLTNVSKQHKFCLSCTIASNVTEFVSGIKRTAQVSEHIVKDKGI